VPEENLVNAMEKLGFIPGKDISQTLNIGIIRKEVIVAILFYIYDSETPF